jgi:hypothetical protein
MASFTAQIDAWTRKSEARVEAVFKQSAQEVFSVAQRPVAAGGNMPVDTGTLRSSLLTGRDGGAIFEGADSYVLAIAGVPLGGRVLGVWTANYASAVHFGARGRRGRMWVDLAAQQWQDIVTRNAREAAARGVL